MQHLQLPLLLLQTQTSDGLEATHTRQVASLLADVAGLHSRRTLLSEMSFSCTSLANP